jgi:hypothetical protein
MKSRTMAYERHPIARKVTMAFDAAPSNASQPSKEEMLKGILEFLAGVLESDLYATVEQELKGKVLGSTGALQPAADRRRRMGSDSAGANDFGSRFPGARRIGFA